MKRETGTRMAFFFFFEQHAQLLASTILHLASHITQFAQGLQSSLVGRKSIGSPSRTNRATRNCDNCVSPAGLFSPSTTRSVTTPAIYKVQSQAKQISARKSPGRKKKMRVKQSPPLPDEVRPANLGSQPWRRKKSQRQYVTGVWRTAVPPRHTLVSLVIAPAQQSIFEKQMHWKGI